VKIAVIGTGYVGLVTGAGFADFGHDVTCADSDETRITQLKMGVIPFHEPELPELVRRNSANGRLRFTTSTMEAVAGADVAFIAVGTPSLPDGSSDLRGVLAAAAQIGAGLTGPCIVVTKSTVPVGTADQVRAMLELATPHSFSVASNPEFLAEGTAVADFARPARVVIGVGDLQAQKVLTELHAGILKGNERLVVMSVRSAEITKYAANAMLAARVSLMNEVAQLCDAVGADVEDVRRGVSLDPRIGPRFLFAGCGFGGSCFGKDLRSLAHSGLQHDVRMGVVEAVVETNDRQKRLLGQRVISRLGKGGSLAGVRVAVWGLAFKPGTDDVRDAPAVTLIGQLFAAGAEVRAHDPVAHDSASRHIPPSVVLCDDPYQAAKGVDALVLATEWPSLRHPDFDRLAKVMRGRLLLDGRNVWSPKEARRAGFTYLGVGRSG
jgi:UDPglucose 6-dehydrogenase